MKAKKNPTKKTKQNKPRPRQSRQRAIVRPSQQQAQAYMSNCARAYLHTLINPMEGVMGCVPSAMNVRTLKQRVWSKGVFHSGVGPYNLGFIVVDPLNSTVNDAACVIQSTAAYALDEVSNSSVANTITNVSNSNFVQGDVGGTNTLAKVRIVGAELRIQYTGTKLNEGGQITLLHDPDHRSLMTLDQNDIANSAMARRYPIKGNEWFSVKYYPTETSDLDVNSTGFQSTATVANNTTRFYMGAIVSTAVTAQPFAYEFYCVYEICGQNIRGVTASHSDQTGLSAALTIAAATYPSQESHAAAERSFFARASAYLIDGISGTVNAARSARDVYNAANAATPVISGLLGLE